MTLELNEALRRATGYKHGVLSFVGNDGFPVSVAGDFRVNEARSSVEIGPFAPEVLPVEGRSVNIIFSHVRPKPGEGYDKRRYISIWGEANVRSNARQGSVTVEATKATGWDEEETPFFEYCERGVPTGLTYMDEVGARPSLSAGWLFFVATRLPFLTATIVPIALGAVIAASHRAFSWGLFLLTLLGGCALHLGLNVANDVFDDLSGADPANVTPTPFSGGSRVIQYNLLSRRSMAVIAISFYAVGIAIGVYLAETRGRALYAIGIAGILISLAYTAPPLRLVHRGLGEGGVALGFGPITTVGAYYVLARQSSWEALYASLPIAILIALVLYVNEIPDREGDAASGKRTLIVRWSKEAVVNMYLSSVIASYTLITIGSLAGWLPLPTLAALLTIPIAIRVWKSLNRYYYSPYSLMPAMQMNIGLHLFTGLLMIAGYLVSNWLT